MLLTKEGHVKLSDFGLSRISIEEESVLSQHPQEMRKRLDSISLHYNNTSTCKAPIASTELRRIFTKRKQSSIKNKAVLGTPDYLAPELLLGLPHGPKVDWWSLGICIYEWLLGYPPFMDDTPDLIFANILSKQMSFDDEMSPESIDLVKNLLNYDPEQRFKEHDVKDHGFFDDLYWKTIRDQPAPFVPQPKSTMDTSYFDERTDRADPTERPDKCINDDAANSIPVTGGTTENEEHRAIGESSKTIPDSLLDSSGDESFSAFSYTNVKVLGATNLQIKMQTDMNHPLPPSPSIDVNRRNMFAD